MNRDEQFEHRLQRQQLRQVPAAWREEILQAAARVLPARPSAPVSPQSPWWRELFWPRPVAWAALAGVWLVIVAGQLVARDESPPRIVQSPPPSREMRELLRQQAQLFSELVGLNENQKRDHPKGGVPQPRSSRRNNSVNT